MTNIGPIVSLYARCVDRKLCKAPNAKFSSFLLSWKGRKYVYVYRYVFLILCLMLMALSGSILQQKVNHESFCSVLIK